MLEQPVDSRLPKDEIPVFSAPVYGTGVIRELAIEGQNIIRPWGVEFADSSTFFSLEDGFGYRYDVLEHWESSDPLLHHVRQVIRLREGLVKLELTEQMQGPRAIRRTCTLTCLEDTVLMDFVLRFRFIASAFPQGCIAGRIFPFAGSCIYHQHPVRSAAIGNDQYSINVEVLGMTVPAGMKPFVYLRDAEDAWVLHLRMLPVVWNKEIIKLCSRWFGTRALPQWLTKPILRITGLKAFLWYKGEQHPYRNRISKIFSPNAYPMAQVKKGETLSWDAVCRIEPPFQNISG